LGSGLPADFRRIWRAARELAVKRHGFRAVLRGLPAEVSDGGLELPHLLL
jgi:hypothetical protein